MDGLGISSSMFVVDISPIRCCSSWGIKYKLLQLPPFDQITYLFLQLETIFRVMAVISVKFTVFVLVSSEWVSRNFFRPFHEFLILDLHKYLSNEGVERR